MKAVRNIRLCTKDCLCLYVCPTGATNTETGQIDGDKCLDGCRICVDACTSHAISLVPRNYPPQQVKSEAVNRAMKALAVSKCDQSFIAKSLAEKTKDPIEKQFAMGLQLSNRIMAEDLLREAGFMLPQSDISMELLTSLMENESLPGFPKEKVARLMELLKKSSTRA